MQTFFEDGRLELDNNFSKREAFKPFVMGRKNFLFAITHDGAEMTCGYYSIDRTAQYSYDSLFWNAYLVTLTS